ncbi:MAG: PstS family phosphate ABC transporter substrate-binding protein [Candidatus Sumerlaeaceae bacterium]|nr:PstS family phosphate ABC transporter substrate-binding protein [Candidatus Sumerlaeaceae bacterium]
MKNLMHSVAAGIVAAAFVSQTFGLRAETDTIRVDGSSTVYPVTEAVAEEFQASTGGKFKVTVGISGTGGGFKKFGRGETDISNASRPILEQEIAECRKNGIEFIELPVAFDALTVMVNPQNTWVDKLTTDELKRMWEPQAQGKITNWKQIRDSFPDAPLKLYGAGADSGTFDYFTEAIMGKPKASRGDFTASEDDNVLVQGISTDKNAIGYFGYAYYAENKDKLKAVPIDAGKGPVAPTEETVINATYAPLSRPIFIYVSKKSLERPAVRQFVEFYLKNVADLAREVKYVPLPPSAYEKGLERLKAGETGTAFGGHSEVGLHIDELFNRPLKK